MKTLKPFRYALLAALMLLATAPSASAQDDGPVYEDGSVWSIDYIRTEPGQFDNYMENLSQVWKRVMDRAKERGYILSYQVLSAPPGHREDWDLMLMVEFPNMAALDNQEERFGPIRDEVLGSLKAANEATAERRKLRESVGSRLTRELVFKQ